MVISKPLVSLLLNVSLDFFYIFNPDSDRGVRRGEGGAFESLPKKLNNFKTVQSMTTKLSDFS